jgi:Flp pilus assembly protein TadG
VRGAHELEVLVKTPWRSLAKDKRGAVYVEFLAVFFPLFAFFLSLVQFAYLQSANIIVNHAAIKAARTAAVVLYGNPADFGGTGQGSFDGTREAMVKQSAQMPLVALGNASSVTVAADKGSYGRDDIVTVTVKYDYVCRVPLGRILVCGTGGKKSLTGQAAMQVQGTSFIY